MKKLIILFILFAATNVFAGFVFQDNTFRSQLRVCYGGNCTNLDDMNHTELLIDNCYETRNDRVEGFDLWDNITQNPQLVATFLIVFIAVSYVYTFYKRRT